MDLDNIHGYAFKNLGKINVIMGKNGCGKSTALRQVESVLLGRSKSGGNQYGNIQYITPERGGNLIYSSGTEESINQNSLWLSQTKRANRDDSFRQKSISLYKRLEMLVLREIETTKRDDHDYTFDVYISQINELLDRIQIRREGTTFKIYRKRSADLLEPNQISSGETELISLAIECLTFSKETVTGQNNILFLDEPDVHLHPDLQFRFMKFLIELALENDEITIIIATHSTAIIGALDEFPGARVSFMQFDQKELDFEEVSESIKKIIPVFGAHPLSNVFNSSPILLVEGEDDRRIWDQAIRSSNGKLKIYPCSVDSVDNINEYELEAQKILSSVYDAAKGYSLRDKDDTTDQIGDMLPLYRMKLKCRNAENMIVTDEVLASLRSSWSELEGRIQSWLESNEAHPHFETMNAFKSSGYDRKSHDIKEIRNDLMGIIGSSMPWEVAVGKAIAKIEWDDSTNFDENNKLHAFLGEKAVKSLIPKTE